MILDVRCPRCKSCMKYQYNGLNLSKKRKTCVYCGKSFAVRTRVV